VSSGKPPTGRWRRSLCSQRLDRQADTEEGFVFVLKCSVRGFFSASSCSEVAATVGAGGRAGRPLVEARRMEGMATRERLHLLRRLDVADADAAEPALAYAGM
jgi:hypothetical protein